MREKPMSGTIGFISVFWRTLLLQLLDRSVLSCLPHFPPNIKGKCASQSLLKPHPTDMLVILEKEDKRYKARTVAWERLL